MTRCSPTGVPQGVEGIELLADDALGVSVMVSVAVAGRGLGGGARWRGSRGARDVFGLGASGPARTRVKRNIGWKVFQVMEYAIEGVVKTQI